ncbi:MAG: ABC transporter permease [Ilumatobacter sp.]|nr:MAG: ABC transporter permease [Ilumatobacter sp.]
MNLTSSGPQRAAVSQWQAGRLVARREIIEALRSKTLWITAALFFIGSALFVVLPDLLGGDDGARSRTIAVTDEVGERVLASIDALGPLLGVEATIEQISDRDEAAVRVADGELDALVRFDTDPPTVLVVDEQDQALLSIIREAVQSASVVDALVEAGLDDATIASTLTPTVPVVEVIDTERGGRELVALLAALVTFVLVLLLAMEIATGVAVEKSSRVSEVLLAIVPVRALLFGKVVGTGIIGVSILLIGSAPVLVRIGIGAEMPAGSGATLAAAIVFSVVGLVQYLCVAAALGALVERSEDVNATVGPLTVVLFAGYIAGRPLSDSVIGLVLALFPLTSPLVMPSRVALGTASLVEVLVALGLLVVGVMVAARFATVVYRRAIVRTGARLRLRDLRT